MSQTTLRVGEHVHHTTESFEVVRDTVARILGDGVVEPIELNGGDVLFLNPRAVPSVVIEDYSGTSVGFS